MNRVNSGYSDYSSLSDMSVTTKGFCFRLCGRNVEHRETSVVAAAGRVWPDVDAIHDQKGFRVGGRGEARRGARTVDSDGGEDDSGGPGHGETDVTRYQRCSARGPSKRGSVLQHS